MTHLRLIIFSAIIILTTSACVRESDVVSTPIPTAAAKPPPTSTVLPSPTTEPSPTPQVVIYSVQQGDTLLSIAQQYGTTVEAIVEANPDIENPDVLQIGQEIRIPLE